MAFRQDYKGYVVAVSRAFKIKFFLRRLEKKMNDCYDISSVYFQGTQLRNRDIVSFIGGSVSLTFRSHGNACYFSYFSQ